MKYLHAQSLLTPVLMLLVSCSALHSKKVTQETCPFELEEQRLPATAKNPLPSQISDFVVALNRFSGKPLDKDLKLIDEFGDPYLGYSLIMNGDVYVLRSTTTPPGGDPNFLKTFTVARNGAEIASFQVLTNSITDDIHAFYRHGDDWIVDFKGGAMVNGKLVGKDDGFDDVFFYRFIDDTPFYMYRQGGKYGVQFGETHCSLPYSHIIHGECCERSVMNPRLFKNRVVIFAQRKGKWVGSAIKVRLREN